MVIGFWRFRVTTPRGASEKEPVVERTATIFAKFAAARDRNLDRTILLRIH